jgi:hypothetical protein
VIVGRDFAWGHMGKTGGDAIWAMFRCVPDLIEFAHAPTDPEKHRTFRKMGVTDRPLVLNLRRLPSLVLSYVHHARNYGLDATLPKGTVLTPADAAVFPRPERMINNHTDRGRLPIARWLRMENLREDFLDWVSTLRPLTDDEVRAIRTVPTKPPMPYDHDPEAFFSAEQIETLYRVSPTWARYELEVYGDLPVARPVA